MEDADLKSRLAAVLGRGSQATGKEQDNKVRMQKWVEEQASPALRKVQHVLHDLRAEDVAYKWDGCTGAIVFRHAGETFSYLIELTVSPRGITGATHIRVPGQEERTHGPLKDIVNWTQDQIVNDFLKGLDSWHPEQK
jgi:hypothetical protein